MEMDTRGVGYVVNNQKLRLLGSSGMVVTYDA